MSDEPTKAEVLDPKNHHLLPSLGRAFNVKVGDNPIDKILPTLATILFAVWGSLVAAEIVPEGKWLTFGNLLIGALYGLYLRHSGRLEPPTPH